MSPEPGRTPPLLGAVDYLAEVAKDWARHRFATAKRSDFALAPARFDLHGHGVRRRCLRRGSPEAEAPLSVAGEATRATAWCRPDVTLVVVDTGIGDVRYEQEIVEVLVVVGGDILAEAAFVVRAPGLPPCLGQFLGIT